MILRRVGSVVLIDDDLADDRRVQRVVNSTPQPVRILDVRDGDQQPGLLRALDLVRAAWLVARGLRNARARRRQLTEAVPGTQSAFAGLASCVRATARAVAASRRLRQELAVETPALVHANDLVAGLAVALAKPDSAVRFVYDSHELQIQRHRQAGWLRILIEHDHERRVLEAAQEVLTVNRAVARAMQRIHPALENCPTVVLNDLYAHREIPTPESTRRPALVYIGKGTRGRLLERLDAPPDQLGFAVHLWLLGSRLPAEVGGQHFAQGAISYEAEVMQLCAERRCLMWCALDLRSLSYRLATPNKLFQALALGMPIVATSGSYLEQIVLQHGIGVIDDGDLPGLAKRVQTAEYVRWVANVKTLRERLRSGAAGL